MTTVHVAQLLYRPETPELRFLPEGPYPAGSGNPPADGIAQLSWVAIQHGAQATSGSLNVLQLGAVPSNRCYPLPGRPGFAFPCDDGQSFIAGVERELGYFTPASGRWEVIVGGIDQAVDNTIINDGMVWEDNLIFGLKELEFKTPKAGLYLFRGSDRQLIQLRDDQICSNGKAIRRKTDGGLELIDIDSPTRQVAAYDLDIAAGTLGPRRVLLDLTADPAVPDGAILTPDGSRLIVSMFYFQGAADGETRCYRLDDGSLQTVWKTPGSPQNTCPNLVQVGDRVKLVITTASENMTADVLAASPNAGCLFIADTDFERPTDMPAFPRR